MIQSTKDELKKCVMKRACNIFSYFTPFHVLFIGYECMYSNIIIQNGLMNHQQDK